MAENRDALAAQMTREGVAAAQALSRNWRPAPAVPARVPSEPPTTARSLPARIQQWLPKTPPEASRARLSSTGTGFFVNASTAVTADHVIAGCAVLKAHLDGKARDVRVAARDQQNDLAVLAVLGNGSFAVLADGRRLRRGQSVVAVGFPLSGLLSGLNVTTGTLSALAGVRHDNRMVQISAPVQAGHSGGPLLDDSGNVIGVIIAKLNAAKVFRMTGDLPQNVNFAIRNQHFQAAGFSRFPRRLLCDRSIGRQS
jgi:S1-C subfamily serine protease